MKEGFSGQREGRKRAREKKKRTRGAQRVPPFDSKPSQDTLKEDE